jgi:transposase
MHKPNRLDFTAEQVDALIDRLNNRCLQDEDYPLLAQIIQAMVWLNFSLQEKTLSIRRLRMIFGIKTETAEKLLELAGGKKSGKKGKRDQTDKKNNHGHRPSSEYTQAKTIAIAHQTLKKGSICPSCLKGRLFNLSPGTVLHIKGQPWLQVEIYKPERLRCSLCGKIFTSDCTAKAIVSLLKYRGGVPFYRQGQLQEILGAPISASEIWEMTENVADALQPIYGIMLSQASNAAVIHNDDTKARVLSIAHERKELEGTDEEDPRKGTFTTCILARLATSIQIALFFTGRNHAGENLDKVLEMRTENSIPIQQCDGGHNVAQNHETQLSHCLAHARRYFYELASMWPKVVTKIIGWFAVIFSNDKSAPTDAEARLKWHQEKSKPIMEQIKEYVDGLIKRKEVEPNSSMGKAIAYFNNHYEELTLFLRIPDVPLTNNTCERLMKRPVLNRKNAYFYRNEIGAKIGDIIMSMTETCILNHANPWDYLVGVQKYQGDVRQRPNDWMPWNFQGRLKELQPP